MRNFIVKYFALDYMVRIGSKKVSFVRAANIIFPLMVLNGLLGLSIDKYPFETFLGSILLIVLLLALFVAFIYFKIKPIQWRELDNSQKWQYGHIANSMSRQEWKYGGKKFKFLTKEQSKEWHKINSHLRVFSPLWVALINPILIIITILVML